jgi:hypothetical protein
MDVKRAAFTPKPTPTTTTETSETSGN